MNDLLRNAYGLDKKKATEGVWVVPSLMEGRTDPPMFKIASASKVNKEYHAAITAYAMRNRRKFELGVVSAKEQLDKALDFFVNYVLLDWRNLQDPDGNDIPYKPEYAKRLMLELDDLYTELSQRAFDRSTHGVEQDKEDMGKSESA